MYGTVMHAPGDVRYEEVEEPRILKPTDAIIKLAATCICGSDLWPYRGHKTIGAPLHMGHEYCGVVVEVGSAVKTVRPRPTESGPAFGPPASMIAPVMAEPAPLPAA